MGIGRDIGRDVGRGSRIWRPWSWGGASNDAAIANARAAAVELSRGRVEREEVALYLAERSDAVRRTEAG